MLFFTPSPLCSVAIGIGFYGNSEAHDGMYQLTSSLLTANYTLASIDLLVSAAPPLPPRKMSFGVFNCAA